MGDLVDDKDFDSALRRLQFETELFLENGVERRLDGVWSFLASPFDLEVEAVLEAGMVLDGTAPGGVARRQCQTWTLSKPS